MYEDKHSVNIANKNNNDFIELSEYFLFKHKSTTSTTSNALATTPTPYYVKLTDTGIHMLQTVANIYDEKQQNFINYADIVGIKCSEQAQINNKSTLHNPLSVCRQQGAACLTPAKTNENDVSAYLHIYAYVKEKQPVRRLRVVHILQFNHATQHKQQNQQNALDWQQAIVHNKRLHLQQTSNENTDWRKRLPLLILLNPKSGAGKSRELFHKQMLPLLHDADMPYELQVTTSANSARELLRTRVDFLHSYSGVVVLSGDGLFYEVLNGIMARADWQLLCAHLPLGIVPCGSGNGLASSIAYLYDEPYEPQPVLHAAFNCVAGNTAPMDIVRVTLGNGNIIYSFLSIGWGLIADVDIESEVLRAFGSYRFSLWTIHRLISLRTYKGRLTYLPHKTDIYYDAIDQTAHNATNFVSQFTALDRGEQHGWICEENDFVLVHAVYSPQLGADCLLAPKSRLNDGIIYLLIIRAGISRKELLYCFSKLSTGGHLPQHPHKYISMLPVSAFRLEPLCATDGILAVDGERVYYGPIQAEILPGAVKVMVPPTTIVA